MTDFNRQNEINKKADELLEASGLCDDECGEWWYALASLVPRYRDVASDQFAAEIEAEIILEHKRFKDEFRVVESERQYTVKERRLVHESEE